MLDIKDAKVAIPVVLIAGLLWSFGPYVVRNIDEAHTVPWQYLFTRGLVIFLLLNMYLFLEEGKGFYKNYLHWIFDILPKIKLCSEHYPLTEIDFFYAPSLQDFQKQTLSIFDIDENKILNSDIFLTSYR